MKARREHRIPRFGVAQAVLEASPRLDANPELFPGSRSGLTLLNIASTARAAHVYRMVSGQASGIGLASSV